MAGEKVTLTITFTNGSVQKYEYPRGSQDDPKLASMVETALKAPQLLLAGERSLVVIPMSSILSIEISPPPAKLPGYAIKGVQLVK